MDVSEPEPGVLEGLAARIRWQWRGVSIPQWRGILVESQERGDDRRQQYARWMLRDVLEDPGYTEDDVPLNKKGKCIKKAMQKTYGKKKGKQVFHASRNKGSIKGVERKGR
jgi:hypothetical protein